MSATITDLHRGRRAAGPGPAEQPVAEPVSVSVDGVRFEATVEAEDLVGLLDSLADWESLQRVMEVRTFRAAAMFADMNSADSLPSGTASGTGGVLPGTERARQLGGPGTPRVREFAAALLATRLEVSPFVAGRLIADALDVRGRLPRLWAGVCVGRVRVHLARKVAQATRHLSEKAAGWVDAEIAEYADGRLSWARFCDVVDGKVAAADPEAAAAAERRAGADRFVRVGQSNEHGIKTLYIRALGRDVVFFEAMVEQVAAALEFFADTQETDRARESHDIRRARAIGIMAQPVLLARLLTAYADATNNSAKDAPHSTSTGDANGDADGNGDTDRNAGGDSQDGLFDPDVSEDHPEPEREPDPEDEPEECAACGGTGSSAVSGDVAAFARAAADHPELVGLPRLADLATLAAGRALVPKVTIYLHLDGDAVTRGEDGIARWEGEGPITLAHVREHFGPQCQLILKPVIDLARQAPVDAYEIGDQRREAVHLRTPCDIWPWANNRTRNQDIDHTDPYVSPDDGGPPGQTRLDNLGPMTRFHHRMKTHTGWQVKQPFTGIFIWRTPLGDYLLEDHTGTRRIT
jgi:hypothetical protein